MRSIWNFAGKIGFWLCWPLLFLYLPRTQRTRVVVLCGNEVLVVRGWLGSGRWGLPGGGLHRGERPQEGAMRELQEETGIEVNATELQKLYSKKVTTEHGLTYQMHSFGVRLDSKPHIQKQRFELTHIEWIATNDLLADERTGPDVREAVLAFLDK